MPDKHLHIVCLDVPFPPDYGGVVDLFYKIKTLHELGVKIHLHCFEYGRGRQEELNQYCQEVHYYPRFQGHRGFSIRLPYIVASRSHPDLLARLNADDHPVLLEGIHCTYFLHSDQLKGRKVFLRLHNVEWAYYRHLAKSGASLLKTCYYLHESRLLRRYEAGLANKASILAVSMTDLNMYRNEFEARDIQYLPVFTPYNQVTSEEGIGSFCLYHGNLSVPENEKAAAWLLTKVFGPLKIPLVIAGRNPSHRLEKLAHRQQHTCMVANPSPAEMEDMISKAHIHILPSFNRTGIKLKLLHSLARGRHCVVNEAGVEGTGLESACHVGNSPASLQQIITLLYHQPFTGEEILIRKKILDEEFDNNRNGKRLLRILFE